MPEKIMKYGYSNNRDKKTIAKKGDKKGNKKENNDLMSFIFYNLCLRLNY